MRFKNWLTDKETYTDSMFSSGYLPRWVVDRILAIEKKAYPSHYRILNQELEGENLDKISLDDMKDFMDCHGKPVFHIGSDWYILACDDGHELEIQDLASQSLRLGFGSMIQVKNFLTRFKDRVFVADARDSTSWQIINKLVKKGVFTLLEKEPWNWSGETFHTVKFKFNQRS